MLTILSIIGLICLLRYVSKGLTKFGTWLEMTAEHMTDRAVSKVRTIHNGAPTLARITKAREALITMKREDEPDEEYMTRVRDEIENLTAKERE